VSAGGANGGGPLTSAAEGGAPPPGAELLAAVGGMKPVRTRAPVRQLALIAAVAAVFPVVTIVRFGLRADLGALPPAWVGAMALAWAVGLAAMLLAALIPRRGEVLPDAGRAARFAVIVGTGLLLLGLFATVDAPGRTRIPETSWAAFTRAWWHCTSFSLKVIAPVLVVSALVMRRLFPVGHVKVAGAIGAAGGAAAGLTLHFICGLGGSLHVGFAHAGGVAVGALVGMLVLPRILRG
jgi:hypothetical protein